VLSALKGKRGPTGPAGANGANGAPGSVGPRGPRGEAPAALPTGASESGTYAVAGAAVGTHAVQGFAFPLPLPAPLDESHVAFLNGAVTAHCPGVGKAANGYLCVYASANSNLSPNGGHGVFNHEGLAGADTGGFMVFFDVTVADGYGYGSWTVTGA
jgi:hypothetical protein